jgi:hypothetical protein
MSAAWIPIFGYLEQHRKELAPQVPPGFFLRQRGRPWIGVAVYVAAIAAGWFINPWLAICGFVAMVVFHAFTSEGMAGDPSREQVRDPVDALGNAGPAT